MISYQDFCRLLTDMQEFETLDAYIAECGGSVNVEPVEAVIKLLEIIWELGHDGLNIDRILKINAASLMNMSQEYKIPYRTLQGWRRAERNPPEWLLPMIAYAVLSDTLG